MAQNDQDIIKQIHNIMSNRNFDLRHHFIFELNEICEEMTTKSQKLITLSNPTFFEDKLVKYKNRKISSEELCIKFAKSAYKTYEAQNGIFLNKYKSHSYNKMKKEDNRFRHFYSTKCIIPHLTSLFIQRKLNISTKIADEIFIYYSHELSPLQEHILDNDIDELEKTLTFLRKSQARKT